MTAGQLTSDAFASLIVTLSSVATPVLVATSVKVTMLPTFEYVLAVVDLVIDSDAAAGGTTGLTATLAVACAVMGWLTGPAVAVTTLRIDPEAPGATCTVSVMTTDPLCGGRR